jgi:hypothetical protein
MWDTLYILSHTYPCKFNNELLGVSSDAAVAKSPFALHYIVQIMILTFICCLVETMLWNKWLFTHPWHIMHIYGRAVAQAVSRQPFTAESRVRARANPCGIYGGQSGTGTGFSPSCSVFPCQYNSIVVLHTHILSEGWTICPVVAVVQRRSLTPTKTINYAVLLLYNAAKQMFHYTELHYNL